MLTQVTVNNSDIHQSGRTSNEQLVSCTNVEEQQKMLNNPNSLTIITDRQTWSQYPFEGHNKGWRSMYKVLKLGYRAEQLQEVPACF